MRALLNGLARRCAAVHGRRGNCRVWQGLSVTTRYQGAAMLKLISACMALCCLPAGAASAQDARSADATDVKIRVSTIGSKSKPIIGTRVSMTAETLRIVPAGRSDTVALAMASIRRVEESAGRRSRVGDGALVGGLIGAGAGLAFLVAVGGDTEGEGSWIGPVALGGGTVLGALFGAAIGAASQTDRWVATPTVTVHPGSGGLDLGMAVRVGPGASR